MQIVTAYEDNTGRLHKRKCDAVRADFAAMIKSAWGSFPKDDRKGDDAVIANYLASDVYPDGRKRLMDAILYLEENARND